MRQEPHDIGTGHALHWEEPVHFAADLVAFINNLVMKSVVLRSW